jgi:TetR/AcrR family transcriptional regulator
MSDKHGKSTEQAIMEAAEKLFLEKGYARTSTIEIAKVAGCNQSLVHYYYRSKKNLFGLVFRNKAGFLISSLTQINEENLPFEEKMRKRIFAHFEFIKTNWRLPVLFLNEIATNSELIQEIVDNFSKQPFPVFAQLQKDLNEEFEKGNIRKTDAINLIFSVFSLNVMTFMLSPVFQMISKSSETDMENILEKRKLENFEIIMNSLRP